MVETTSRMASSSSTTSIFSTSTVGRLPGGLNRPRSHYKGQHTNPLEPLPIQQTACSFTDKYSSEFRPIVRGCSRVSGIVKRISREAAQGVGESGPSGHRFFRSDGAHRPASAVFTVASRSRGQLFAPMAAGLGEPDAFIDL